MTNYKLNRTYYKFVITNNTTPAEDEQKGFIDSYNSYDYADFDGESISLDESKAKALGYIRWLQLSLELSQFGVFYSNVLKLNGADYKTTPTSIEFVFGYNQPASIICVVDPSKYVEGDAEIEKLRDGRVIYKGAKALKEIVAKVMASDYNLFVQYFNPDVEPVGKNPRNAPIGFTEEKMLAGKLFDTSDDALASITVEEIDEIELFGDTDDSVENA